MKHIIASLSIMATTIAFGSTTVQPPKVQGQAPPKPAELIKQMDKNNDGKLELSEVKGPLQKDFPKVDLNKDGFITLEELEKAPKPTKP